MTTIAQTFKSSTSAAGAHVAKSLRSLKHQRLRWYFAGVGVWNAVVVQPDTKCGARASGRHYGSFPQQA